MEERIRCDRCTFSRREGADLLCKFNPPTANCEAHPVMNEAYSFPKMRPGDWCFQFQAKEPRHD